MIHQDEAGRLWKIIGPGAAIPADPNDPETVAYKRAVQQGEALARAETSRLEQDLRLRREIEQQKGTSQPPPWRRA
jgi:hypothetical protein